MEEERRNQCSSCEVWAGGFIFIFFKSLNRDFDIVFELFRDDVAVLQLQMHHFLHSFLVLRYYLFYDDFSL